MESIEEKIEFSPAADNSLKKRRRRRRGYAPWSKTQTKRNQIMKLKPLQTYYNCSSTSSPSLLPSVPSSSKIIEITDKMLKSTNSVLRNNLIEEPMDNVIFTSKPRRTRGCKKPIAVSPRKESLRLFAKRKIKITYDVPRSVEVVTDQNNDMNKLLYLFAIDLLPIKINDIWKTPVKQTAERDNNKNHTIEKKLKRTGKGSRAKKGIIAVPPIETIAEKYKVIEQAIAIAEVEKLNP